MESTANYSGNLLLSAIEAKHLHHSCTLLLQRERPELHC